MVKEKLRSNHFNFGWLSYLSTTGRLYSLVIFASGTSTLIIGMCTRGVCLRHLDSGLLATRSVHGGGGLRLGAQLEENLILLQLISHGGLTPPVLCGKTAQAVFNVGQYEGAWLHPMRGRQQLVVHVHVEQCPSPSNDGTL